MAPRLGSRLTWAVVAVLVLALAGGVLILDRRQVARGAPSLVAWPWREAARTARSTPTSSGARAGARARTQAPPRVALVVDELGARADVFERLRALGRPVTVAVLPGLPLSGRLAREAARAGFEVLVQLPLEPYRFPEVDPGPGVLLASMSPDEVTRRTRRLVASVPAAIGITTRMGSRFTEQRALMRALLEPVFLQGLFFVDSLTTHRSVGYDLARALGIPAARRQVFVDPDESEATARAGLQAVERWAERRGSVIAIAHGRLLTLRLLAEAVPRWDARGFRLVLVSELLDRPAEADAPRAAGPPGAVS